MIYALVNAFIVTWAMTRDDYDGSLGSGKEKACYRFILVLVFTSLIYGSKFWK